MNNLRILLLVLLALGATVVGAVDPEEMADPALQARYRALTHELRCMQCQNQTIADSPVGLAGDLRREVRELLQQGKSDDEIRGWMSERYGAFILFRPEFNARNAWLWLLPGVLLLGGGLIGWRVLRQRSALEPLDSDRPEDSA
jgi:cytochrome c-type biogenesis protein CcmH